MVAEERRPHDGGAELLLVLPGLGDAVRCAGARLPRLRALETLLVRADRVAGVARDAVAELLRAYPQLAPLAELPHGPLSRLADVGTRDAAWCARADPVHLATVRDHLRLVADLELSIAEAEGLAASCNAALAEQGLVLETPLPERWYLRSQRALQFEAQPTGTVAGRDIYASLPSGADGGYLRRVLTELQMTLHEHVVNEAREQRGELPVNSVWLWGGGTLPQRCATAALPPLWSDDPVVRGLWQLAGSNAHRWPSTVLPAAPGILVSLAFERGGLNGDGVRCAELLERLEAEWVQPALSALRTGVIERILLRQGLAGEYELHRRGLARWWRRPRPLAAQS